MLNPTLRHKFSELTRGKSILSEAGEGEVRSSQTSSPQTLAPSFRERASSPEIPTASRRDVFPVHFSPCECKVVVSAARTDG
jgi:hypothetical protein